MASVENKSQKRSIIFWCLIICCLALSTAMLTKTLYGYYHVYMGRGMEVLSENMGHDVYKVFLAEHLGLDNFILTVVTFLLFAISMIYMMRRKYDLGKLTLGGFLICVIVVFATAFARYDAEWALLPITLNAFLPIIIFVSVICALFYYATKYQRQSVSV